MRNANFFHRRRYALQIVGAWLTLALPAFSWAQTSDPLSSWNDTAPKKAITAFMEKVTKKGTPDFVPAADRIATFVHHTDAEREHAHDRKSVKAKQSS